MYNILQDQTETWADITGADLINLEVNMNCFMWPLNSWDIIISGVSQRRILVAVEFISSWLFIFFKQKTCSCLTALHIVWLCPWWLWLTWGTSLKTQTQIWKICVFVNFSPLRVCKLFTTGSSCCVNQWPTKQSHRNQLVLGQSRRRNTSSKIFKKKHKGIWEHD